MTSPDISVDYTVLAGAESSLAAAQRRIASTLAQLDADLTPLLASWSGDGKDAYTVQQSRWNQESANLNATLQAVQLQVGEANAQYQLTDRQVAAAWGG